MSTTIKIKCIDQTLTYEGTPTVASGGVNEDYVQFEFCPLWDGFLKVAVFYQNKGEIYYSIVSIDNIAVIPKEVIATKGTMYLGVLGVKDNVTKTSLVLPYRIENGALDGFTPEEPTQELYQQVLNLSNEMVQKVNGFQELVQEVNELQQEQKEHQLNLNKEVSNRTTQYNQLSSRMDTLTSLAEGSTTGDAELQDIRVGYDGAKYDSAGSAVRTQVSELKEGIEKLGISPNLYDASKRKINIGISTGDGTEMEGFNGWVSTDYIQVKKGDTLFFSNDGLAITYSTGAFYDLSKKVIESFGNDDMFKTKNAPSDGFARFSFNIMYEKLQIEKEKITSYMPYGTLLLEKDVSEIKNVISDNIPKWKSLKLLTLGDSITAMGGVNGWTYWINQYLQAEKVVNVSVAGSTWQDRIANQTYDGNPQPSTDGNVMGNQVQKVLNAKNNGDEDYQDFDVITFSFGTNDYIDFSTQTKESVENQFVTNYEQNNFTVLPIENVDRQTLAGAIRYGFQKLHEAYPNAVIFVCTPTQECYETFESIYKKSELINYIANRCGAETIDTLRCGIRNIYESQTVIDYDHPEQSGVAPIQTDLLDGIHTNENGARKIAKYNAREIMKYFMLN